MIYSFSLDNNFFVPALIKSYQSKIHSIKKKKTQRIWDSSASVPPDNVSLHLHGFFFIW